MTKTNRSATYIHRHKIHSIEVQRIIDNIIKYIAVFLFTVFLGLNSGQLVNSFEVIISNGKQIMNNDKLSCNASKQELNEGLIPLDLVNDDHQQKITAVNFENGTWKVTPGKLNYAIGTSLINLNKGNTGLYSDSIEYITKMQKGDKFEIIARNNSNNKQFYVTYQVENSVQTTEHINDLFFPTDDPRITLIHKKEDSTDAKHMLTAFPIEIKGNNCR